LEYSNEQIKILQLIHDADNHGINSRDMASLKIDFPNLEEILQAFIENDIIEYEAKETKYYLAYEGFEILENKEKPKPIYQSNMDEYEQVVKSFGSTKQFHKTLLLGAIFITIFAAVFVYFNPKIANAYEQESKYNIDEATIQEAKRQIKEFLDSVEQAKELQKIEEN